MECPIGLLWTSSNDNLSLIRCERIYTLEELDEASCAVRLNLSKELFMKKDCPLTFQWRGKMIWKKGIALFHEFEKCKLRIKKGLIDQTPIRYFIHCIQGLIQTGGRHPGIPPPPTYKLDVGFLIP